MSTDPLAWVGPCAAATVFVVMLSLGLLLRREQVAAALVRRNIIAAVLFAVVVPVPALAVVAVKLLGLKGAVAAGIVLMAVSPGAPVALRRALEAGSDRAFAPPLHLAIVILAVITVPVSVAIMDAIFSVSFVVSPLDVARQVFFSQLVPLTIGCTLRAWKPAAAVWLERHLAAAANVMLLALGIACIVMLGPFILATGWIPLVLGAGITLAGLLFGAAAAGRESGVRPGAAIAVAMRNPGLALLIAGLNGMPPQVTASILAYAIGLSAVIVGFLVWRKRALASDAPPPITSHR
jgi:bile acid:Na+ symporter, BASS family